MTGISPATARLMAPILNALRLRILIEIEASPSTAKQLAQRLGEPYDKVNWALKQLADGRLAELKSIEPAASGWVMQKVYVARHHGWSRLGPVLEAIAASERTE